MAETRARAREGAADDLCWQSVGELAGLIQSKALSPVELVEATLARIEAVDGRLRSYITVSAQRAIMEARTAEAEITGGAWRGPLHGIPFAVKDLIYTQGIRTTCGSALMADFVPDHDAEAVRRLRAAGAILLGKLSMTEFAGIGYHPGVSPPRNPWNAAHWTGQSSSGSGVAVAAGLCAFSLGSDTGGSLRYPASACGVVGMKPSQGLVSGRGTHPLAPSLDTIGPICRSAGDAAHVLAAIAGFDAGDPGSTRTTASGYEAALDKDLKTLRIGFDERLCSAGVDEPVASALAAACRAFEQAGARIVPVTVSQLDEAVQAWTVIFISECAATHSGNYPARAGDYGPAMRQFLESASAIPAMDYARAMETRRRVLRMYEDVFSRADVILTPTLGITPPTLEEFPPSGLIPPGKADALLRFTAPQALVGIPAMSVPGGMSDGGLPIGIQLTGPAFGETLLLRAARGFELATGWHTRHPDLAGFMAGTEA